jgi:hypothetical protein
MPIRKVVGCSFTQASSRSLGDSPGHWSSSSWAVTKDTARSIRGRGVSWGYTERRVAWVLARALTMVFTTDFK